LAPHDLYSDLRTLTRAASLPAILSLEDAAAALHVSRQEATVRMRTLIRLGAARRISKGLFFLVSIKSTDPGSEYPRDAGALASKLFAPCYIGGWSAANACRLYSSFRPETFVVTSSRVRSSRVRVGNVRFRLAHVPERLITGPGFVSRHDPPESGPERTIVDALRSPAWLGGIRPLAYALRKHRWSDGWDPDRFIEIMEHAGTGPAVKRLAALDTLLSLHIADVVQAVADKRTGGIVALEPGRLGGRIDTYSGVRVNVDPEGDERNDIDRLDDEYSDDELEDVDL